MIDDNMSGLTSALSQSLIHNLIILTPWGGTQVGVSLPHSAQYNSTASLRNRASLAVLLLIKETNDDINC